MAALVGAAACVCGEVGELAVPGAWGDAGSGGADASAWGVDGGELDAGEELDSGTGGDGGDGGAPDAGGCLPSCRGVPCGGDGGCGVTCSGDARSRYGAVRDCRNPGDCGCGVEPNDNMLCGGDGLCVVRCSCDCLPPQRVSPRDLVGLDFGGSCRLVFSRSGDPTVWDSTRQVALCPLDHDPQGAARCTECPPCHRNHPPECGWAEWCTCRDSRWVGDYQRQCCAAGAAYCF